MTPLHTVEVTRASTPPTGGQYRHPLCVVHTFRHTFASRNTALEAPSINSGADGPHRPEDDPALPQVRGGQQQGHGRLLAARREYELAQVA